ncbi:MAG: hypothetical protein WCH05_05515 [Chlorobiaceae bacterium]
MHLSISTGMTIEEVRDQFDLHRLKAFSEYSQQYPPIHVMMAGYFGIKKPVTQNNDNELAQLIATLPQTPQ